MAANMRHHRGLKSSNAERFFMLAGGQADCILQRKDINNPFVMRASFTLIFALLAAVYGHGQAFTYQWTPTNSPFNSFRFDDIYFLNPDTGYAVNFAYTTADGFVTRTHDGGMTWDIVWDSTAFSFRDIVFADALHGWVGTLEQAGVGADTAILYQTVDGGDTWSPVPNLPGPLDAGICGMNRVSDSIVVGVGRYSGPASFYKTTDLGATWSYSNLDSLAGGLVDVYFMDADTGFAVGTDGDYFTGKGRVLMTVDGGASWSIVHTSLHTNEICWKISFPSRQVGYISLQAFANSGWQYMLKSTDGGLSWQDINVSTGGGPFGSYNIEGTGFIDDSTGWLGGDQGTFFTSDGGLTWVQQSWGNTVNRFRFLNDSVAFAAGAAVYRLAVVPVGVSDPRAWHENLGQNYPNPFREATVIEYDVPESGWVRVQLFDVLGKKVATLVDEAIAAGNHRLIYTVDAIPDGVYFYTLEIGDHRATKRMVIQR
jgi:photosystem II stability/assembly factor-like uncharacterized protein